MMRVSPPELARLLPGPHASMSVTSAPPRRRCSAVHPPNAPAPTTATRIARRGTGLLRPPEEAQINRFADHVTLDRGEHFGARVERIHRVGRHVDLRVEREELEH